MPAVPFKPDDPRSAATAPLGEDTTFLLQSQRDRLRQNLHRANTLVAAILLATIGLAFLSVLASLQASRNQARAETAEEQGNQRLWRSYLAQARAARFSGLAGRSRDGLEAVRHAAAIQPSLEVRNEAVACLVLPDLLPDDDLVDLKGDEAWVRVAPGLGYFLTASYYGPLEIRGMKRGEQLGSLDLEAAGLGRQAGRDRRIWALQFSPDARFLAVILRDGSLAVWEALERRLIKSWSPRRAHLIEASFTPDSRQLMFQDADKGGALRLIDLGNGEEMKHPIAHPGEPFAFQPGTRLITLAKTNQIVWESLETGKAVRTITAPAGINGLIWSPDGRKMAAISDGNGTFLWNFETGQFHQLKEEADQRWVWTFSPDSALLMASYGDNVTQFYSCLLGAEAFRSKEGIGLAFSQDGQQICHLRRRTRLGTWKLTGEEICRTEAAAGTRASALLTADLSTDGRWLATLQSKGIQFWDLQGKGTGSLIEIPELQTFAFWPGANDLLISRGGGLERRALQIKPKDQGSLSGGGGRLSLGPPKRVPLPDGIEARHISMSMDGRWAALDLRDRRMVVLDLVGDTAPAFINPKTDLGYSLGAATPSGSGRFALSSDGRWLALGYGNAENASMVFDVRSGELAKRLTVGSGTVCFSPDGQCLMVGGGGVYTLFRVGSWERIWHRLDAGLAGQWGCMAFDRGGKWVAVASHRHQILLLDATDGRLLTTLTPPEQMNLSGLRVSFDGNRLVAVTHNNMVQFWDLARLRRDLRTEDLDWDQAVDAKREPRLRSKGRSLLTTPVTVALVGLGAASLVGVLALIVLRRHQKLAQGLVQTEERALLQGRELEVQREVSQLKTNFVSMVSHEFRTPLSVIISSTEILRDYLPRLTEEKRKRQFEVIVDAAQRMKELIEEVLLLGKVESGLAECQPRLVDVKAICEKVASEVAAAHLQQNPIEVHGSADLAFAKLDQNLMEIILSNLLSNAVKYSRPGIPVRLHYRKEGTAAVFDVADGGIGIPSFEQSEVFKPFRRGSNVGKVPGTGLGLTIVRKCVQQHGGRIDFVSNVGEGTTFTVWLPGSA